MTQPPHDPFLPPQPGQVPPAAGSWPAPAWPDNAWQQPGQPAYGPGQSPRGTNGLAIAALVTAFNATPVSIGLAIAALVQLRKRDQAGQGLAIAALVVSSLLTLVFSALLAAGFSSASDYTYGAVGSVGDAASKQVGSCLQTSDDDPGTTVLCEQPHDQEVFFVGRLPGPGYPGADRVEDLAAGACLTNFRVYVGERWDDSDYDYAWYAPDREEWANGEKRVVCVVTEGDSFGFDGSVRGPAPDTEQDPA